MLSLNNRWWKCSWCCGFLLHLLSMLSWRSLIKSKVQTLQKKNNSSNADVHIMVKSQLSLNKDTICLLRPSLSFVWSQLISSLLKFFSKAARCCHLLQTNYIDFKIGNHMFRSFSLLDHFQLTTHPTISVHLDGSFLTIPNALWDSGWGLHP